MTYPEYLAARLELIGAYLNLAALQQHDGERCAEESRNLARSLDKLALELDPFANEATP